MSELIEIDSQEMFRLPVFQGKQSHLIRLRLVSELLEHFSATGDARLKESIEKRVSKIAFGSSFRINGSSGRNRPSHFWQ
jgi:hypothetical protein